MKTVSFVVKFEVPADLPVEDLRNQLLNLTCLAGGKVISVEGREVKFSTKSDYGDAVRGYFPNKSHLE